MEIETSSTHNVGVEEKDKDVVVDKNELADVDISGNNNTTTNVVEDEDGWLERMQLKVDKSMRNFYYELGFKLAKYPYRFIGVCLFITILCAIGLVFNFKVQSNPERLYTPQDSKAFDDRALVEKYFGFAPRNNDIYVTSSTSQTANILDKNSLLAFLSLYEEIIDATTTYEGQPLKLEDVCIKPDDTSSKCDVVSILDVWQYNRTTLENDNDILATLNNLNNPTDQFGRPLRLSSVIGSIKEGDTITTAPALLLQISLQNNRIAISGGEDNDPKANDYELFLANYVRTSIQSNDVKSNLAIYPLTEGAEQAEQEKAIDSDVQLVTTGYILLIIFGYLVLWRPNWVKSRGQLTLATVIAVGMSIVTAFGICMTIGVEFSLVINTLALVLLGLGMDDTFVIMGAHKRTDDKLPIAERWALALSHAGVSITITSMTDFLAFVLGVFTSIPALRAFAIYAAVGITFDFLYQICFFTSWAIIDEERQRNNKIDVISCIKVSDETAKRRFFSDEEFVESSPGYVEKIVNNSLARVVTNPIGKITVIVISLGILGAAIYGLTELKTDFNIEWFTPSDSYLHEVYDVRNQNFGGGQTLPFQLVTVGDVYDQQDDLKLLNDRMTNSGVVKQFTSWYDLFINYVNNDDPSKIVNGIVPDEVYFRATLIEFLNSNTGAAFESDFNFAPNSNNTVATRFQGVLVESQSTKTNVDNMLGCRSAVESLSSLNGVCYSFPFQFFEGDRVLEFETIRNVGMALVGVIIISLILLASIPASMLVITMIVLIDIEMIGFIPLVGLTFNSVISINLVLAIGLAVDYSCHIAHHFLLADKGDRDERVRHALSNIGGSVLNGAISTFLAVVVLANAQSYIFRVFFRMLSLIVGFAAWNGIVLLPVLLSLVGPQSYAQRQKQQDKVNVELKTISKV